MRDEEAVRRFVERMGRMLAAMGVPPMAARVLLTVMTAEEDALSAADLAERLGASSGAISGAVRYLVDMDLLRREPVPGSRRDLYLLSSQSWWEATIGKMNRLQLIADTVDEGIAAIGGPDSRPGRTMAEMRDFFAFCHDEILLIMERWEQRKPARD
ncbi:GbsR/MarR family transcriptional regulator [Streptosporangium sandarakinum]|uniref:GbsR/MarR family transcriptional regulator n=1 Tax=Streptosporangium sandarakinum TaxID=1260955 RepID=UPI0033A2A946